MDISIGKNIKRLRQEKNITQEQLAEVMNVTCAAVSKWERGETYPDITLLQPLAFFFGVTLDELMGYSEEKIKTDIDKVTEQFFEHRQDDKRHEIITKAYHDYPNDYSIMHYYMWDTAGDMADNDPAVLLAHKDEFLPICDKIINGCTEETIRLNAWNMRAKILHAEGKTDEALEIFDKKFADWYSTTGQKKEQLFAKGTDEYCYYVINNMYELAEFAADKLGRAIVFDTSMTTEEKYTRALYCGEKLLDIFAETGEPFFLIIAESLYGRVENDFVYRGGTDKQIVGLLEKWLDAVKTVEEQRGSNAPLDGLYSSRGNGSRENYLKYCIENRLGATSERRKELLKNTDYKAVLEKYMA